MVIFLSVFDTEPVISYLQHPHQNVSPVPVFLLRLGADAVHQVEKQLAGHGLDVTGKRLVIDVLSKELHR